MPSFNAIGSFKMKYPNSMGITGYMAVNTAIIDTLPNLRAKRNASPPLEYNIPAKMANVIPLAWTSGLKPI